MKRIFLIDEHISSKQNGVGTFMAQFLESLKGIDCEVNFLSFNDGENLRVKKVDGYRYYQIPFSNRGDFLGSGGQIFPLLSLYIKDSVENIFFINHSPCDAFMKELRKNFSKSKIVFVIHDQGWTSSCLGSVEHLKAMLSKKRVGGKNKREEKFVRKYVRQERTMYRIADIVVCLNDSTYELLQDIYNVPKEKIRIIPNGIDISTVSLHENRTAKHTAKKLLGIPDEELVYLFVGRPTKAKGLFDLLDAFEDFFPLHHQSRIVVAGAVENLSECTKRTKFSAAHVTYTGLISKEELNLWYQAADVGVLPSYTEQCSYAGLEMMQKIGLVIATDGWGIKEMFASHRNLQEANAIVAHISQSLETNNLGLKDSLQNALETAYMLDTEQRALYRSNCHKVLKNRYDAGVMRQQYAKLIMTL